LKLNHIFVFTEPRTCTQRGIRPNHASEVLIKMFFGRNVAD